MTDLSEYGHKAQKRIRELEEERDEWRETALYTSRLNLELRHKLAVALEMLKSKTDVVKNAKGKFRK